MDLTYKRANDQDLPLLLEFIQSFYELEEILFRPEKTTAVIRPLLESDTYGVIWILCLGSEPVGYIVLTFGYSLEFGGRDAFIDELFIQSEYRGQGLGSQALAFVTEACRRFSVQALHLEVAITHEKNRAFYRKHGFEDRKYSLMNKWILGSP